MLSARMLYLELAIVVVLVVVNGLLAMSELAVVSSRPARLKAMVERGVPGSRRALALASDPGRFLSTVQIGITLVGVLSGAFSGATLGQRLSEWLQSSGVPNGIADVLGVGTVVAVITYGSLIIGELVPKQIALSDPERVAARVAPAMMFLAKLSAPVVWLLDVSGKAVLRAMGRKGDQNAGVTEEEIRTIIAEAESSGVLEADERRMISGVLRLGDRTVRALMTPRTEVDWINLQASEADIRALLVRTPHSRIPVGDGDIDNMVGIVQARDLLAAQIAGEAWDVRKHVRETVIVHDNADALELLTQLREAPVPLALIHDEYGHFEGIVTPADLLEAITGAFRAETAEDEPLAHRREDGSWLLAGYMQADEMSDQLGIPLPEQRDYQTVAGFLLSRLGRFPRIGESVDAHSWRFEVVDLDGRRIDKVLATRLPMTRAGTVKHQAQAVR